jgi:hypothetical protein
LTQCPLLFGVSADPACKLQLAVIKANPKRPMRLR